MADDNGEEEEAPAVELGEGEPVEGAPLVRVASRLSWPKEKTQVVQMEGETVIRTPDGPKTLADVLEDVDVPYFERRPEFLQAVRAALGEGPIPTGE